MLEIEWWSNQWRIYPLAKSAMAKKIFFLHSKKIGKLGLAPPLCEH